MENIKQGVTCNVILMTRKAIFMHFKECTDDFDKRVSYMENKLKEITKCPQSQLHILSKDLKYFKCDLKKKWRAANYIEKRLKQWQIRGDENKAIVNKTKADIQQKFKEKMGLRVDFPQQGGGNSNDGNTSRRVFSDPETSAEIMNMDITLIKRLAVVLEVISCGFEVDEDKFKNYAMETAQLYVNTYGWHPMTPTLHKVLMHGSVIISHATVPIGQLSEEAGEARNKHFRKYRSDFARKFNRVDCIRDVFLRLLLTSDPFISLNRKKDTRKRKALSEEALKLLKEIQILSAQDDEDSNY